MTLEMLKIIMMSCQLGASGMGGAYNDTAVIAQDQLRFIQSNLGIQKKCQIDIINCVLNDKSSLTTMNSLINCLRK